MYMTHNIAMWPCPYCFELHPVSSRVDHLTIRHNRFPCLSCDLVCASAETLAKHDAQMHRYTTAVEGGFEGGAGSVGPVMEVSGFIMEVLLTLRDIKEQQNVQFRTLSEQIVALKGELEEVKRNTEFRSEDFEVVKIGDVQEEPRNMPLELAGEMIYTEPWNPTDYFPINCIEQLKQLEEISRFGDQHAHFKDLKLSLEAQNPDGWNPNGLVEFGKTFDKTFALKIFVTREETPQNCISLDDYKAFVEVLRESWKAAGPKRINRRLRHYLKLNRENIVTSNTQELSQELQQHQQQVPNSTSSDDDVAIVINANGKRAISSSDVGSRTSDVDFVVVKRRRGTMTKLSNFMQQLKKHGLEFVQQRKL